MTAEQLFPAENRRLLVLLVEDETWIRIATADELRSAGLDVLEAIDGLEALALLRTRPDIALVLTDIRMPGLDGDALIRTIRRDFPGLKVVVAAGSPPRERPDAFVPKPYRPRQLVEIIRTLVT
jgi:CheY-like chemotaxis protein